MRRWQCWRIFSLAITPRAVVRRELRMGVHVQLLSVLTKVGRTSIGVRHEMRSMEGESLFATYESLIVRYDAAAHAAAPVPEELRSLMS